MKDFIDVDYTAFTKIVHPDDYNRVMKAMRDHLEGKKKLYDVEYRIKTKNNLYKWFLDRGSIIERDNNDNPQTVRGVVIDITKIKQSENLEKLSKQVLDRLNKSGYKINEIKDIIFLIKNFIDFEAVGIRIKQGDLYPYYETNGLPGNFIKKTNDICLYNKKNAKQSNKIKSYDCMCGTIISGTTDPSYPFFTHNGSFWTNNLSKLLEENPHNISKYFTRDICINAGYNSIALIPIRTDDKIIGIIQINDKRPDVVNHEIIRTLESIGASIGIAFSRDQAINELEINEKRIKLAQKAANIGSWDWNVLTGDLIWSETIEPLFGFKKGKFKGTYEAFIDCVHPDDRDIVIKSVDESLFKKKKYAIEHRIVWPNSEIRWVLERGDVIRDKNEKPIRMLGVVQDITNKREMEEKLRERKKNLEKIVEERTKELVEINKKLKDEIYERKKAEEYANRTKQRLRDVIDSASELIISFDMNDRVTVWNKTIEIITGYKQIEVLNRSVGKLEVFDNPQKIIECIRNICSKKNVKLDDIVLKTKDNEKRIIRISGSEIIGINKDCVGSLLIGKDITQEIELHRKLLNGNSYLIPDKDSKSSIDLFYDLIFHNHKGLLIVRGNPAHIKTLIPKSKDVKIALLTNNIQKDFITISDLQKLNNTIKDFTQKNMDSIILLDGIHYLISRFSFDKFIEILYNINDTIVKNKSILFLRIDPQTIDEEKLAILENELEIIPSQKTEDLTIEDELFDIIKYIYEQNQLNAIVSLKKVMNRFKIAYVTTANRLDSLEKLGLLYSKKQGKIRAIFLTDKANRLIHMRKSV